MTKHAEVERLTACAWADFLVVATFAPNLSSAERSLFSKSRFRKSAKGNSVRPGIVRRWLGGVVPNDSTLLRMNRRIPGSLDFYSHPLWRILQCIGNPPNELLYPLIPAAWELMFVRGATGPISRPTLKKIDAALFQTLEVIPTMDGLAALLFCVKRLLHEVNFTVATQALNSFYRVALMLGAFRPLACVMPKLVMIVCRGFPLSWASARWVPEAEIEQLASQSSQLLASELLGGMATLPTAEKRLTWVQIGEILAGLFEPRTNSFASHAYSLSLLLAAGAYDSGSLPAWGNRALAWMGVEELAPPPLWTSRPSNRRNLKECNFAGLLFNSWMEVESHTVRAQWASPLRPRPTSAEPPQPP